jgi:GTP-binding protein Era
MSDMRAGYIAIVGKPNVGKSTLMNRFIGEKLSAVTPKPQTTRHKIMGILNTDDAQAIFLDTPGILQPKDRLHKRMMKKAESAISDSDLVLWMVEPFSAEEMPDLLKDKSLILAINKIDKVRKESLLSLMEIYNKVYGLEQIVPISAKDGAGCDLLLSEILKMLPEHSPYFDEDIVSTETERFFAEEILREKIFLFYGEEIPYSATVQIEEFVEREKGKDYIKAVIYVERDSQKAIMIGGSGKSLKKIGVLARKDIEDALGRSIYLELYVKTKKDWRKKDRALNELGY